MLTLSFLGPPVVEWGGEPAGHFVSNKSLALFCYLAMRVGLHAREHLAGLLWGEMTEERAKANLRMALYNLQKLFPGCLVVTRINVAFNHAQPYWLDVDVFKSGLDVSHGQVASLRSTIELYRGEFLENLYVKSAPDFEVWLVEQREHLRLSFLRVLEELANHYMSQGDWTASIEAYRRLLVVDSFREDVNRRLMLALAQAGRYDAALEQYQLCCRLLREELCVEPTLETMALYERIQIIRSQPRPSNLPSEHVSLIGKETELREITRLVEDLPAG